MVHGYAYGARLWCIVETVLSCLAEYELSEVQMENLVFYLDRIICKWEEQGYQLSSDKICMLVMEVCEHLDNCLTSVGAKRRVR